MVERSRPPHYAAVLKLDLEGSSGAASGRPEARRNEEVRRAAEIAATEAGGQWTPDAGQGDSIRQCFADPLAAVRCAFALRHYFANPALQMTDPQLPAMRPRIALHYGEVDPPGGLAGGHAFQVATPLESQVRPGEIWATGELVRVCELTEDSPFVAEYLRSVSGKKLPTPHEVYRLHLRAVPEVTLGRGGPEADPVQLSIELLRADTRIEDRIAAADALGMLHDRRALQALIEVARNGEEPFKLRREALLSIEQHADPTATGDLIEIDASLGDEPVLQRVAIQALGATGDPTARAKLVDRVAVASSRPGIREAALLALRHLPLDGKATATLTAALGDADPAVVSASCVAAAGAPADPELVAALVRVLLDEGKQHPLDVRAAALETLLLLPTNSQAAELLAGAVVGTSGVGDIPPRLRPGVVDYLGGADTPAARNALLELAQRPAETARAAAVRTLAALQSAGPPRRRVPVPQASSHERIIELRTERKAG